MNRDEIQANLIKASHMISMDDIIREGYPTLREVANDVTLPLSDEDIILGEKKCCNSCIILKILSWLKKNGAPWWSWTCSKPTWLAQKKVIAVLIPNEPEVDEDGNEIPPKEAYKMREIMYNAKVVSHSVQDAAVEGGEGCLSVDREVPGYVVRHARVTVEYYNKEGEKKKNSLKRFPSNLCST